MLFSFSSWIVFSMFSSFAFCILESHVSHTRCGLSSFLESARLASEQSEQHERPHRRQFCSLRMSSPYLRLQIVQEGLFCFSTLSASNVSGSRLGSENSFC